MFVTRNKNNFLIIKGWTDVAKFMKNFIFNRNDTHYWIDTNPHVITQFQGN